MAEDSRDCPEIPLKWSVGIRLAREFGFPTLVLCVVGWWVQSAAVSIHYTIVVPWLRSHTDFVNATHDALEELAKLTELNTATLRAIGESQGRLAARQEDIYDAIRPRPPIQKEKP